MQKNLINAETKIDQLKKEIMDLNNNVNCFLLFFLILINQIDEENLVQIDQIELLDEEFSIEQKKMDFLNTDFFKIREKFKSIESDYNISNSALEEKTKNILKL